MAALARIGFCLLMSKTFRPWTIDRPLLLPPSVQDFVASVGRSGADSRFELLWSEQWRAIGLQTLDAETARKKDFHRGFGQDGGDEREGQRHPDRALNFALTDGERVMVWVGLYSSSSSQR